MMGEQKITALIVEDDPVIAEDLTWNLKDFGYSPFPPVASAADALLLLENVKPDFVLLDVTLKGETDGISLGEEITKRWSIPLVFLTAHHDRRTMERIKALHAAAYLVKPLQIHSLQTAIELALYNHSHRKMSALPEGGEPDYVAGDFFFIKVKNQLVKVELREILLLEAADNYAFIYTRQNKYMVSSNLKALEGKLPDYFMRVHRSYVVNLKAIDSIEEESIAIGEHQVPLGKTHREDFMKRINLL